MHIWLKMDRGGYKMDICYLRNKRIIVLLIIFFSGILLFCLYQRNFEKNEIDGNFTKPMININGYIYGTTLDQMGIITEDYAFYGYVKNASSEDIKIPSNNLEVSKIIEDNIGYKVYISKDKDFVAIFNEQTQKYDYFKKEF